MSFVRTTRLFNNEIRLDFLLAYFLDFLAACFLAFVVLVSMPDLEQFSSGVQSFTAQPIAIGMFGALGLYGTRISMYIAIARNNKAPQILEWWSTLIGLSLAVICLFVSGYLLEAFGSLHGYRICHISHDKLTTYQFVLKTAPCTAAS